MSWVRHRTPQHGGSAPATPGFNAVAPEWLISHRAVPAAESTLGSHPCVALSSAQVLPEWINRNLASNRFATNGDNPLNFVSHSRGSLQSGTVYFPCFDRYTGDLKGSAGAGPGYSLILSELEVVYY
jgi:hypothetical protein